MGKTTSGRRIGRSRDESVFVPVHLQYTLLCRIMSIVHSFVDQRGRRWVGGRYGRGVYLGDAVDDTGAVDPVLCLFRGTLLGRYPRDAARLREEMAQRRAELETC